MFYRQLLLSTGGGVLSKLQMDDQEECATIAIGLGGTGVSCLRNLKKQIFSRVKPDSGDTVIPTYSHIRFLAVDSDRNALRPEGVASDLTRLTKPFRKDELAKSLLSLSAGLDAATVD